MESPRVVRNPRRSTVEDVHSTVQSEQKLLHDFHGGRRSIISIGTKVTNKFQQNQHEESRKIFEQKVIWQKQDVKHLKDVSLWNQTHDKIVEMLARTVCTLYARICLVFIDTITRREMFSNNSVLFLFRVLIYIRAEF